MGTASGSGAAHVLIRRLVSDRAIQERPDLLIVHLPDQRRG